MGVLRLRVFLGLAADEDGVVSLLLADEHGVQLLEVWQNGNGEDSEVGDGGERVAVDGHILEFRQVFQLLQFAQIANEVAVQVEGLQLGKILEGIVQLDEMVVRNVNPLQVGDVVHHASKHRLQPSEFPQLVVTQHEGRTHQFNVNRFFLLLLQLLFGLQRDILHR